MKIPTTLSNKYVAGAFMIALSSVAGVVINSDANAVMSKVSVRFDRMQKSTTTTGTVCATPNTVGTESNVTVTYPSGYSVSSTTANWTTGTTNLAWPSGATAWPTIGATASSVAGQAVTWSSGDLTVGTLYCFNWTTANALTQPSTAAPSQLGTVATNLESGQYATQTVDGDQITVTATVPASFAFSLNNNTDAIGTLSTASVSASPSPRVATVSTNSKNGWNVWARNINGTLNSALNSYAINTNPGSNSTLSAGTEGYNMGVVGSNTGGTGTLSVAAPFVGGVSGKGGGLDSSLRLIASSTGQANGSTLTLTNNVAISPLTPAGSDYTDTITVVGAGLF